VCVCVCVCVSERGRDRGTDREKSRPARPSDARRMGDSALETNNELNVNELNVKGLCPARGQNLRQVVSIGGRLIVVLDEAAVELDVEQRLALVCRLELVAYGARGRAVACHQVPHLHPA